jgi:hypothetical protein
MYRVSGWLGAGALTAGVSAAVLAGAGAAHADAGDVSATTASPQRGESAAAPGVDSQQRGSAGQGESTTAHKRVDRRVEPPSRSGAGTVATEVEPELADEATKTPDVSPATQGANTQAAPAAEGGRKRAVRPLPITSAAAADGARSAADTEAVTRGEIADVAADSAVGKVAVPVAQGGRKPAVRPVSIASAVLDDGTGAAAVAKPKIRVNFQPLVRAIGSAFYNLIGAVVRAVDGPPLVPRSLRDSIQVGSSTLVISPGNEVPADWYFPTHGQPAGLIYLQHGILASSPMYSYTAALLAERTNSVVVATSITSNQFAAGGLWLGGDKLHEAVAQLFLDEDRTALNASMATANLKAGGQLIALPTQFALVGHSLGGGFAPGVAGHYAEGLVARRVSGEAANHLVGVVLLDGVPVSPILPNAMGRLKTLEGSNGGAPADYIPVYEIGAPRNFLNSTSAVNEELAVARPGKFNGVVIKGGVHMDGMLGGNPLIQNMAYLIAGIPKRQNPTAVQHLMAGWINDMFAGRIDPISGRCLVGDGCAGVYGDAGETVVVPGDHGEASAVVIDSGPLPATGLVRTDRFQPLEAASILTPQPATWSIQPGRAV